MRVIILTNVRENHWFDGNDKLYIHLPLDFNMAANLGYLGRNKNECMFDIENNVITRVVHSGVANRLVEMYLNDNNQMIVQFIDSTPDEKELKKVFSFIWEWFDLDRDLSPFYRMAKEDPLLEKPAQEFRGLRVIGVTDLFEALCWGVLGQQINLAFAYTLKKQFVERFGESIEFNGKKYWTFPTYKQIAKLTPEDLADIKMTVRKSEYIIGIAKLMDSGELSKEKLLAMDFKDAEKSLIKIRGIGPWTANYVLMRCLRFPTAFPIDDVGLHNAIKFLRGSEKKPSKEELMELSLNWSGWQAYATFYLWRVLY
ncbi:DNA-3-methyladenine glycosylase [Bacillus sp. AFS037270]|uniref:DNA-3-methyladenine glycosylase family protein n=1 Tax=Bacillus sp. AFS037270 TaxID=2033499 RepID=UPI000BFEA0C3|nr:DNA-3-methyladenine glycosylase [Bacillus sp. AFS037270]PGV53914.1 DNA-3-methyladenine glycosylase [Bacillus sp. AFS037270]